MKRHILRRGMVPAILLIAALVSAWELGLLHRGPTFKCKSARQWSSALKKGETVFGCPVDAQGRSVVGYPTDYGSLSFCFRRMRSIVLPKKYSDNALNHLLLAGPDGVLYAGRDVDPAAAPVLIALLNDDAEKVRNEAAFAIAVIGNRAATSAAVPALVAMLTVSRANRLNAAYALGRLGPRAGPAIPALVEALKSDDPDIQKVITEALSRIESDWPQ